MWQLPKLCKAYIRLIYSTCERCPKQIAQLSPDCFKNFIDSLKFGILHIEQEICRKSLEAFRLAFQHNMTSLFETGNIGFAEQEKSNPGIMADLLRFLLHFMLFQEFSTDLNEYVSSCFYFIAGIQLGNLETFMSQLLAPHCPETQTGVLQAFRNLIGSVEFLPDRKSLRVFQEKNEEFLSQVKSVLLTK